MIRTTKEPASLRGLPGQDKARRAIDDKVPLSEKRYLKTPTVFGFHGVYRALARDTGIEQADRLGEVGYELVSTWEKEQGLKGFSGTSEGHGKAVRRQLLEAVRDGINGGAVARKAGWVGWQFFTDHLGIYGAGKRESHVITQALLNPASGFRREVLGCLIGPDGMKFWSREKEANSLSERRFHELVFMGASQELRQLLEAISNYERFCRLLQDAFDDCLYRLSQYQTRIEPSELGALVSVKRAAKRVPEIFGKVSELLAPFGEAFRFQEAFSSLAEGLPSAEWVERLLDHHRRVQYSKPPAGKAPWFDRFDDGACIIRTGYIRETGGRQDDNYVHAYRTQSLWSFARDLELVK
jgi:hypothetical protein